MKQAARGRRAGRDPAAGWVPAGSVSRSTPSDPTSGYVSGWRGLVAGVIQFLGLVLPFLFVTVVVSHALPGGGPPPSQVIGCWTSDAAAQALAVSQPFVVVHLAADGRCELRVKDDALVSRSVQGRYEVVLGRLVMHFPTHRMVWSFSGEGRELHHRTRHGLSYRLLRA